MKLRATPRRSLERARAACGALLGLATIAGAPACSSAGARPEAPPCDEACREEVALRGVRETLKVVFNLGLQGKPVGPQDVTVPCPMGGSARVVGEATSNPEQGSTFVELTYTLTACAYDQRDDEPDEAYALVTEGTVTQAGVLAVQPTSTTALRIESEAITVRGRVYDPSSPYEAVACPMKLGQNGSRLAGTLCGREVGTDL